MSLFSGNSRFLRLIKKNFSRPRGVIRNPVDKDPYVKDTLKLYNKQIYSESCYFTRAGGDVHKLEEQLQSYDREYKTFSALHPKLRYAILQSFDRVKSELKLDIPVVPKWIYSVDVDKSKSTGYPWFKKKGDMMDELFETARHSFHKLKYYGIKAAVPPTTFATKGKLSTQEERKTRLVWQYPGDMTICEGVYAQPLIQEYLFNPRFSKYFLSGSDAIYRHQTLVGLANRYNYIFYGLDFKQYDSTVPPFLIRMAFDILRSNISFNAYDDGEEIQVGGIGVERRSRTAFDALEHYFIYTPFLTPEGHLMRKHGGIPSGSHFTNLVGSIITRIIILATHMYQRSIRYLRSFCTNGDDSAFILSTPKCYDLEDASWFISQAFGMTLSIEKTSVARTSKNVHLSGTNWKHGYPVRPTAEWFKLALASKSYVPTPQASYARLLGLYISGGFTDVKFCEYFRFFQTCYELRPERADRVLEWRVKAMGFDPGRLRKHLDLIDVTMLYR